MTPQTPQRIYRFFKNDYAKTKTNHHSPWHFLIYLTVTVFVVELIIMLAIEFVFNASDHIGENLGEALLDASFLTLFVFPILYYFSFRPLLASLRQHQATENELSTSYTFLEKVFASLNDAILVVNMPDYEVLSCNAMAEALLGVPRETLIGGSIRALLFSDDAAYHQFKENVSTTLAAEDLYHDQMQIQPCKDLLLTIEITVTEMQSGSEPTVHVFSLRDITQKVKSEQQLRLHSTAFQAAANGIMITDTNGTIEWANPALSEMTGFSSPELIGENARIFNAGVYDSDYFKRMWETITAGHAWEGEMINKRKDGSHYIEVQSVAPVRNNEGEISHFIAIKQDITQRKKAEAQLERQNQELRTLDKLGQTVVSSLELDVVLDQIVTQMLSLLDAQCFTIILQENRQLIHVAAGGSHADLIQGKPVAPDNEIPQRVMAKGKAVHISEQPDLLRSVCSCQPQALIAAPLKLGDEVFGLIQASHDRPDAFRKDELRILQAAANWAAIAISHAHQLKEIRRRLHETATLSAINQNLNETLDLDSVLQLIADSTPKLIQNVDSVVIHLLDEKEDVLYPAIWSGQSDMGTPTLFMNPKEGAAGYVQKTGKLLNITDVTNSEFIDVGSPNQHLKSLMMAPLLSGRYQLGSISVHNQHLAGAFSTVDEKLLMRLANSAAVAINTARLYQAERKQRQFAEDLASAAALLGQSLRMEEVLTTILQQTTRIVGSSKAAIFLLKNNRLQQAKFSYGAAITAELPYPLPHLLHRESVPGFPPLQLILDTGKPIIVSDVNRQGDHGGTNGDASITQSPFAAAPLRTGNEIIGFLNVYSDKSGAFSQHTLQRLEALAAHATLSVQNARLYQELEESLEKEQTTRAQLVQAQKLSAMGRLVASVAHELNNPLQIIKNCLFLTQQDIPIDHVTHSYLNMALTETTRLSNLVLELRDVYRPPNREEMMPVILPDVIEQVILILNQHLIENDITLQQDTYTEPFTVIGEANQLKQVLLNICLNAIEAMQPDGGELSITVKENPEEAAIGVCIQDTGPGIPPDVKQNLFEPFFTTKDSGVGLGLSICYDIVQKHGGSISVENAGTADSVEDETVHGSNFTIWLPLA